MSSSSRHHRRTPSDKRVKVLGVATHAKWNMANWINGIVLHGGIPCPIGLGQAWGGWLWRTKQVKAVLDQLADSEIVMITDVYDAFVVGSLDEAVREFKRMKVRILVSVEEYWSPKGLEQLDPDFTEDNYARDLEAKFGDGFCQTFRQRAINAGQIIGYVKDLRALFAHTVHFMSTQVDDDQAALYALYLPYLRGQQKKAPFALDFDMRVFSTLSNMHQYRRDWTWDEQRRSWRHNDLQTSPPCLHFAGEGKFEVYRLMGRKALGDVFNYNCRKKGK